MISPLHASDNHTRRQNWRALNLGGCRSTGHPAWYGIQWLCAGSRRLNRRPLRRWSCPQPDHPRQTRWRGKKGDAQAETRLRSSMSRGPRYTIGSPPRTARRISPRELGPAGSPHAAPGGGHVGRDVGGAPCPRLASHKVAVSHGTLPAGVKPAPIGTAILNGALKSAWRRGGASVHPLDGRVLSAHRGDCRCAARSFAPLPNATKKGAPRRLFISSKP